MQTQALIKQCVNSLRFQERSSSILPFTAATEKSLVDLFIIMGLPKGSFRAAKICAIGQLMTDPKVQPEVLDVYPQTANVRNLNLVFFPQAKNTTHRTIYVFLKAFG